MTDDLSKLAAKLTEGEVARIMLGRGDWRESDWQDHCGLFDCEQCNPEGPVDPIDAGPLDTLGRALKAHLEQETEHDV